MPTDKGSATIEHIYVQVLEVLKYSILKVICITVEYSISSSGVLQPLD